MKFVRRLSQYGTCLLAVLNLVSCTDAIVDLSALSSLDQSQPEIEYHRKKSVFIVGQNIVPMTLSNYGGEISSLSISPSLPAGLSFNSTNGEITGTPTTPTPTEVSFIITAESEFGQSTADIHLRILNGYIVNTSSDVASDLDDSPGDGNCQGVTSGMCSMRAAITESNAASGEQAIGFDRSVTQIDFDTSLPDITGDVAIVGNPDVGTRFKRNSGTVDCINPRSGAKIFVSDMQFEDMTRAIYLLGPGVTADVYRVLFEDTVSGTNGSGVLMAINTTLWLENSEFRNLNAIIGSPAIYVGGTATVRHSKFDGNSGSLGAIGVAGSGTLTVEYSQFLDNVATSTGGAIDSIGNVTVAGSYFDSNDADSEGGAIACRVGCDLTLTRSLLVSNSLTGSPGTTKGGAISINNAAGSLLKENTITGHIGPKSGAGVYIGNTTNGNSLINNTIFGNTASDTGGGVYVNSSAINLVNNTIYQNHAALNISGTAGGGGLVFDGATTIIATLSNNIIAKNTTSTSTRPNCNFTGSLATSSVGNNLTDSSLGASGEGCGFDNGNDLLSTDPLLGSLDDYGGWIFTLPLLSNSPAIDAGANGNCPSVDQRGYARDDGACDIGAFEYGAEE